MSDDKDRDDSATCDPTTGEPYLNRTELAQAFDTTEPTVDRWIAAG